MQAGYLLNLTFPHPSPPKAANEVASPELLINKASSPNCVSFSARRQRTSRLQLHLHGWLAHGHSSCHSAGDQVLQGHKHPRPRSPPWRKRRSSACVGPMLGEMSPDATHPHVLFVLWKPSGANYKSNQAKNTSFPHNCALSRSCPDAVPHCVHSSKRQNYR